MVTRVPQSSGSVITPPPTQSPLDTKGDSITSIWENWMTMAYTVLFGLTLSGSTLGRPTQNLWVGQMYFDTTLNKPIWIKTIQPVVWIDATGTVV